MMIWQSLWLSQALYDSIHRLYFIYLSYVIIVIVVVGAIVSSIVSQKLLLFRITDINEFS